MSNVDHGNASIEGLPRPMHTASATTAILSDNFWTRNQEESDTPAPDLGRSIAELTPESLEPTRISPTFEESLTDSLSHEKAEENPSAMEITWGVLDPVSDTSEPAIIPDFTDYMYHEDEEEEDDASIHHDSDTISVADYQNKLGFNGASRSAQDLIPQTNRVLPTHLNDLLEQWYARHGRIAPSCVCKRSESAMGDLWCLQKSRTPVTWLHRSGVPLNVTWYPLPGNQARNQGTSHKLIVVSGPGVAPSIVTYKNAGGHITGIKELGVVYRIWRGLDGDQDGFEFSPSVIKMSRRGKPKLPGMPTRREIQEPILSVRSTLPESTVRCEHCMTQHLGCDRKQPTCSRCASTTRLCHYREAPALRASLDTRKVENAFDGLDLQRSERARRPTRRYTSEELVPARKRKVKDTSFDQDDEDSDTLLGKFMAGPLPTCISSPSFLRASKSKPWVCYLCGVATTNKKDMRSHFKQVHGLNPDESRMKWTDSREGTQKAQTFVIVPNARETPVATKAVVTKAVADVEIPRATQPAQEEAPPQKHDQELEAHIRNNTKVIFFSRTQTPRVRRFSACDSSNKIFAQATAGGVFSREHARVLAVEVDDQESELPIVEDDDEDFQYFIKKLTEASCWSIKNGQVEGDMVVHVREKRM